jgi:putative flippase GtrA
LDRHAIARSPDDAPRPAAAAGPARGSFRRFLVVGGTCTAVQYALLAGFVDGLGIRPVLASGLAYAIAVVLNYELSRRWTFFGRAPSWREFGRFVAVQLGGLALNVAIFEAVLRAGAPHYLLAQVAATAVVMSVNFTLYRLWAFRD